MAQVGGEWGWCELEALLAEDTQGGPGGGTHSSSSVQGCLEVVLVFCRGGTRRRQSDKDMAQQPEGAGPAVSGSGTSCPSKVRWPQSHFTKMKPLPADRTLSSLLSKAKLSTSVLSKSWLAPQLCLHLLWAATSRVYQVLCCSCKPQHHHTGACCLLTAL